MSQRVFFLGAGFSKAINPRFPTLLELSTSVKANFLNRYQSGPIRERFNEIPFGLDSNVEQFLSYLISDWPWKSSVDKDLDLALYKAYVYEIFIGLRDIVSERPSEEFLDLLKFAADDSLNSILSLNYDDLVEELHRKYWRPTYEGWFAGVTIKVEERYEKDRQTRSSPYVVNEQDGQNVAITVSRDWITSTTTEVFKQTLLGTRWGQGHHRNMYGDGAYKKVLGWLQGDFCAAPDRRPIEPKVLHLHGSVKWDNEESDSTLRIKQPNGSTSIERIPYIVPPVLDKSRHYSSVRLREEWSQAHAAIERANEIVFIGFSFPLTDLSCQFLFKSATQPGTRIWVVNRDPSVRTNYESVFGNHPTVKVDFTYCQGDDALTRYIRSELWT